MKQSNMFLFIVPLVVSSCLPSGPGQHQSTLEKLEGNTSIVADSISAAGDGLFDNGFYQDSFRSELGAMKNITLGECAYPQPVAGVDQIVTDTFCPNQGSTLYQQSNYFSNRQNPTNYWVIENNNEPSAYNNQCNLGPPNQSLPITNSLSGKGVINFEIKNLANSNRKRAYFALKNEFNPCGANTIAYTSIGAQKHRGNNDRLISRFRLQSAEVLAGDTDFSLLKFNAAITHCQGTLPCLFYLNIYSKWGGKTRFLILTFGHLNHPGETNKHVHWNWPAKESMHYPGADIAYLRCSSVGIHCLQVSSEGHSYSLSMGEMLKVASQKNLFDLPLPLNEDIKIHGVGWAMETTGASGQMHTWIDGMSVSSAKNVKVKVGKDQNNLGNSITLLPTDNLVAQVVGVDQNLAQSCLEVVGRPITELNGDGSCGDLSRWVSMQSSTAANSWQYTGGSWKLVMSPVGSIFVANQYRLFWRNFANGKMDQASFTVLPGASTPSVIVQMGKSWQTLGASVSLRLRENLYAKAFGMSESNGAACLEVFGRPVHERNGEGWCENYQNWTNMVSSSEPGQWKYVNGVWELAITPVSSIFPVNRYRAHWRNKDNNQRGAADFTVVN